MLDLKCLRIGDSVFIDKAPSNDDVIKSFINSTPIQLSLYLGWQNSKNVDVFVEGVIRCHEALIVVGKIISDGAKWPVICDLRKHYHPNTVGNFYVRHFIEPLFGPHSDLRELTNEEVEEMRRKTGNPNWGCGD